MIEVRPLNPVRTVGDPDTVIACFSDSEWRNLIELVRRYGFKSPDKEIQSPRPYDYPVVIDPKVSQGLLEAISAVYSNEEEGHIMPDVADTDPGLHVGQ